MIALWLAIGLVTGSVGTFSALASALAAKQRHIQHLETQLRRRNLHAKQ